MSGSEAEPAAESAQESVLLNFLPHALQTFRNEPALAITLCYLLVAMAGIFYNYSFYQKFGIPILTLSQISDFLVAGLQQPLALLLVLSTFPLCWLADKINLRKRRSRAARREAVRQSAPPSRWRALRLVLLRDTPRWFTGLAYLAIVVVYAWYFVTFYARHRAEAVKRGEAPVVAIWLNGAAEALAGQGPWTYLGAVSNYVFVYDHAANRAVILPVNSVARIEPKLAGTLAPNP